MKKLSKLGAIVVFVVFISGSFTAHAFNSGTHLYIAEQVFPNITHPNDLFYGSIAPDLSLYVAKPQNWLTSFKDTHYDFIDLRPYALGPTQKAFASGWLTHNEFWGADYYAHIKCPIGNGAGYVIQKAEALVNYLSQHYDLDLNPEFAHYVIEVAIDLLLKNNNDNKLGEKLLLANLFRSWEDRNLLVKVLVLKTKMTDWITLTTTELTFRNLVNQYAMALVLPSPYDKKALVELGVKLALEMYGAEVTKAEVMCILEAAISLCEGDYQWVILDVIRQIRGKLY